MFDLDKFLLEEVPAVFAGSLEKLEKRAREAESEGDPKAQALRAKLEGIRGIRATLRFELTGDDGRDFYFNQADGRLAVEEEPAEDPLVSVAIRRDHLDVLAGLAGGETGADPGSAGGARGMGRIGRPMSSAAVEQLRGMKSVLKFVLSGLPETGEDVVTVVRLGPEATGDEADMTLTVAYDTVRQLAEGQITPPQAFMMGLLKIEGDMSIAMRLATLGAR